jgi:hypothetical protein
MFHLQMRDGHPGQSIACPSTTRKIEITPARAAIALYFIVGALSPRKRAPRLSRGKTGVYFA